MTLSKQVVTASSFKRIYNFPEGELHVFPGTKRPCKFIPECCNYITYTINRIKAACALRQLKRDCRSVTSDEAMEGE
jgi:hypothetical protein